MNLCCVRDDVSFWIDILGVLVWWCFCVCWCCCCCCSFAMHWPFSLVQCKLTRTFGIHELNYSCALILLYFNKFQFISTACCCFFVSFHICYHHLYAYPMSRQTQKTKKSNVFDLMFILCVYAIGHCAYVGAINTGNFFYILFFYPIRL